MIEIEEGGDFLDAESSEEESRIVRNYDRANQDGYFDPDYQEGYF